MNGSSYTLENASFLRDKSSLDFAQYLCMRRADCNVSVTADEPVILEYPSKLLFTLGDTNEYVCSDVTQNYRRYRTVVHTRGYKWVCLLRRDTELPYDIEKRFLITNFRFVITSSNHVLTTNTCFITSSKLDNMSYDFLLTCPSELIILSELIIVSLASRTCVTTEIDEVNS